MPSNMIIKYSYIIGFYKVLLCRSRMVLAGIFSCEMPNRDAACYFAWTYAALPSKYHLYSGYFNKSKIFRKKLVNYLVISIKIPIFVV